MMLRIQYLALAIATIIVSAGAESAAYPTAATGKNGRAIKSILSKRVAEANFVEWERNLLKCTS